MPVIAVSSEADPLLDKAIAVPQLELAWQRVEANAGAAGGDGITVERFAQNADAAIARLARQVREGLYRPGPARRVMVPKKKGGERPLDIPTVVDRVLQTSVAMVLGPMLEAEMEDGSFAYRPGRGVGDAVRRIASLRREGFHYVVEGDIIRYFENVDHERLLERLEGFVGEDRVLDLIGHWLLWYAPHGRGLPQGSPISPLLANLYLDSVDEAIASRGLRLVRYADDFVILARTEATAKGALLRIGSLLAEHGLLLHPERSRVVNFAQGFRFLGHLFVRSMVLKELPEETEPTEAQVIDAVVSAPSSAPLDEPETGERGNRSPGWRVLYVLEPGRRLAAEGESFMVEDGEQPVLKLQAARVGRIETAAHVLVSSEALNLAASRDIPVARIDGHGQTLAEWLPPGALHGMARRQLAQAGLVLDAERRLQLARTIVAGRLVNQRAVLSRSNRLRKDEEIVAALGKWRRLLRSVSVARSVSQVMGFEGQATALYWPALARCLDQNFGFDGRRRRRQAGTPFDIVLNGLCSLLERDVRLAILRAGLHPGFGVLHATEDREESLVFDLMEEFRAPLVEATAVALVNRRAISPEHFWSDGVSARISSDGWSALVRGYEGALSRPIASPAAGGEKRTWRAVMSDQAMLFARHCEAEAEYAPIAMDY